MVASPRRSSSGRLRVDEGRAGLADDGEARDAAERRPLSNAAAGCLSPPRLTAAMLAGLAALFAAAAVHFQGDAAVCTVARGGQHGAAVVCLDWRGYYTMWVTLVSLVLMARDAPPDLVLSGATLSLLLLRVITDAEALRGFASPSIATVGVLFVLAKALEQTGAVDALVVPALGAPRSHTAAVLHVCVPTALLSAFLNNTPIVAMLIPACETLARRHRLSARVLLMPLSFASMLGGMCTLIGTSTNLVLNSQLEADVDAPLPPQPSTTPPTELSPRCIRDSGGVVLGSRCFR
mmetsp:Transcript_9461/g.31483  ORF Transcript_9461/g.31483 Transcript_9461/m.31483 type:complete len:293 (+) Transcript_9461:34-912(+)